MSGKVCANCGQKVVGTQCFRSKCQQYFQEQLEQRIQNKLSDYQKEIELLSSSEPNSLTLEDYKNLKKIKIEVNKWNKELKTSPVKSEVEQFLKEIEEVEKKFPERIKLKYKFKSSNYQPSCIHKNITWNDFFKPFKDKNKEPYCLDCGEDENKEFTREFQRWYCKKIEEWLDKKGLQRWKFIDFLRKKDYYDPSRKFFALSWWKYLANLISVRC